jgi:adenylate kinase family enzyme
LEQGTALLGNQVGEIMESGGLVSSAIMVTLIQKRMSNHPDKRILLDGFLLSRENAEDLVPSCGTPELPLLERILKRGESGDRPDDNITGVAAHSSLSQILQYNH